jgi:hypothetical protein
MADDGFWIAFFGGMFGLVGMGGLVVAGHWVIDRIGF